MKNLESIRNYCIGKPGFSEDFPFDEETLVFRVHGKIFLLTGIESYPLRINLKCNPEWAMELREQFPDNILPGYHMNKQHWNTVIANEFLDDNLLLKMIDHSYDLIYSKLPKKIRLGLV